MKNLIRFLCKIKNFIFLFNYVKCNEVYIIVIDRIVCIFYVVEIELMGY